MICNFTDETVAYEMDPKAKELIQTKESSLVIANYKDTPEQLTEKVELKPYEARVYMIK